MKAFILSTNAELVSLITRACERVQPPVVAMPGLPSMQAEAGLVAPATPDVVIFDSSSFPGESLVMLERIAQQFPKAVMMLLSSDRSPEALIAAMRAGVREVLPLPVLQSDIEVAIDRISQKLEASTADDGKILSFISCKGGSGATFIAANLSYALATLGRKRVLLIDLNQQFGDAALYVSDQKPVMTLADICAAGARLDINLLESGVLRVSPNFSLLAASDNPDPAEEIRPENFENVLQLARRHFDFVVIDMGRQVNTLSIRALDSSDLIFPVLQQSLPYLRNARRLLDIFSSLGYRREKIQLTLNRHENSAAVTLAELERVLDQRVAHRVPNNYEIANDSINQGVPVLQMARSSSISKSLAEWVNRLVDSNTPSTGSIIRRIFVRNSAGQETH
ncbi:MAG: hypothetical protein RL001_257 [Pseudomonadota bacterium]